MTISIDAEKAFNKIQHPFMIKKKKKQNSPNVGHRGHLSQQSKGHIQKFHIIVNGEKVKAFPLRSGKRQGGPL